MQLVKITICERRKNMYFYMNDGVCKRSRTYNIEALKQKIVLSFQDCNILKTKSRTVKIEFCNTEKKVLNVESFKKDIFLKDVILEQKDSKTYTIISQLRGKNYGTCIALLRNTSTIPGEIYIPKKMTENIDIIRQIKIADIEADYGDFISEVYLLKVKLKCNQELPIFYNHIEHDAILNKKNGICEVVQGLKTYHMNKNDYISLSDLCN